MSVRGWTPLLIVLVIVTSGTLGAPFLRDEVPFSEVQRSHFQALAVATQTDDAPSDLLVVRVRPLGDAAATDLAIPYQWLEDHARIRVVEDPGGAPLYLTSGDLAATSGRGTLGATLPSGMAVEMQDARVWPCVVAHEILHFVGLRHVDDPSNIMSPHCMRDQLDHAMLEQWQLDRVRSVDKIQATLPTGVQTWAYRA